MNESGFGGCRVVSFESRRAAEMASLVERHGGVPVIAPTLRDVSITENPEALAFARRLREGGFDVVVLMTGVGTRALLEEVAAELDRGAFTAALARVPLLVARGPKPAAVLRELGLTGFVTVPSPNTWREIAAAVEARGPLTGLRVGVQEHGAPSDALYERLRAGGALVTAVQVYRWALPEDTAPLRRALHEIAAGGVPVALFTSRAQVEHAFAVAAEEQVEPALREALRRGVVASIGPVCSEALRAEGLEPDLEPEHPKMGHLVKAAAEQAAAILATKSAPA
jgi:uroporphyrinogen-III synthase